MSASVMGRCVKLPSLALRLPDLPALNASDGALLPTDFHEVTVAASTKIDGTRAEGHGWTLDLAPGWVIVLQTRQLRVEEGLDSTRISAGSSLAGWKRNLRRR
jgi:hypothetical protein